MKWRPEMKLLSLSSCWLKVQMLYHFFISALEAFGVDDVQVIDFGGIRELTTISENTALTSRV